MSSNQQMLIGSQGRAVLDVVISANVSDYSLNLSSISGYIVGQSDITITVNSGVYVWASTTSNYGMNLTGGATGDKLTIINNGFIIGAGGLGGLGRNSTPPDSGGPGSSAINIPLSATIDNTNASAYIAGGGGGGCGGYITGKAVPGHGGGGAGGGAGGGGGGSGGGIGASGSTAATGLSGGGGGRILPGTGGAGGTPGSGDGKGGGSGGGGGGMSGGNGGSSNSVGGGGGSGGGGGGGGWGASGGTGYVSGGIGGKAVNLNGNTVTWVSGDTTRVYGGVS